MVWRVSSHAKLWDLNRILDLMESLYDKAIVSNHFILFKLFFAFLGGYDWMLQQVNASCHPSIYTNEWFKKSRLSSVFNPKNINFYNILILMKKLNIN